MKFITITKANYKLLQKANTILKQAKQDQDNVIKKAREEIIPCIVMNVIYHYSKKPEICPYCSGYGCNETIMKALTNLIQSTNDSYKRARRIRNERAINLLLLRCHR